MLLVHVVLQGETDPDDGAEFSHLATDSGAEVLAFLSVQRDRPDPATFLGRGKVAELAEQVSDLSVDLVLFDRVLSPVQERNLERALQCRVVDRVGLILDIFARRAHTHEGKLQVELAQLTRLRTRLIRGWTHLERQRGGIGLRGPGETQLETDRRLIGERIRSLRERLVKVAAHRATQRRARQRAPLPTVALVGYTNAGKSSLFNALTESSSYAADRLFATLDPAIRRLQIAGHEAILLADTVGFLRDLPTDLIAAFRATLEEVNQAQLLLHVVDGSAPDRDAQIAAVDAVLTEIGADEIPRLLVLNKVDLTGDAPGNVYEGSGNLMAVRVSARSGAGIPELLRAMTQRVGRSMLRAELTLTPEEGALRARLHRVASIVEESFDDQGMAHLIFDIDDLTWRRMRAQMHSSGCQAMDAPPTIPADG
ncbi:GTPase HflX [Acidithiobacillus ferrooxidans]|uniref:GTPase HflX n=1 Tax=Acidithiobacillus ferrooxidans TaxID=920 RepID=A0A179B9P3_ACIFR|nr:GTPase HflX [Acidithiobacillus ferriphilus]MBU2853237.1 GTPase HflX [Acidithiobacillus ferriphilus]MBW9247515.1 GTPase HflX [Acidithiobacillus ferriphilus]MBW9255051.1 GTPase HflX [Acidithiobacillus ferriphilus]OAP87993.1 GTPase HflX [Acidithiobacillus ferrooxidans]